MNNSSVRYLCFCVLLVVAMGLFVGCGVASGPVTMPEPAGTPVLVLASEAPTPTSEPTAAPTDMPPPTLPPTQMLFGQEFDTYTETINIDGVPMEDTDALFAAIPSFPNLTRVEMDDTGLTDDQIGELFYAFPDICFVWTIQLGYPRYRLKTDTSAFTTSVNKNDGYPFITSEHAQSLKYCTDLIALDLGHNRISDISFIAGLTKLEILILCDNRVSDISVLENLQELSYIELMMNDVTDVSALAKLPKLTDLHLGSNEISDFSPLYTCKQLERLWVPSQFKERFPNETRLALLENLPDCTLFYNYGSHHDPWKDSPRYAWMRGVFKAGTVAPPVKKGG